MIHEILSEGTDHARSGRELAKLLNCNLRVVTVQIEKERRAGWPICANVGGDNAGYYLASNPEELERYCGQLYRRGGNLFKTRRALISALEHLKQIKEREAAENGA